eukprot:Sspe_Gene.31029::Locus_15321_Transcript_1_3_Confidence_0.500_Length_1663::g.31029::m.31029
MRSRRGRARCGGSSRKLSVRRRRNCVQRLSGSRARSAVRHSHPREREVRHVGWCCASPPFPLFLFCSHQTSSIKCSAARSALRPSVSRRLWQALPLLPPPSLSLHICFYLFLQNAKKRHPLLNLLPPSAPSLVNKTYYPPPPLPFLPLTMQFYNVLLLLAAIAGICTVQGSEPALLVYKTIEPKQAVANRNLTVSITIYNVGDAAAYDVALDDSNWPGSVVEGTRRPTGRAFPPVTS